MTYRLLGISSQINNDLIKKNISSQLYNDLVSQQKQNRKIAILLLQILLSQSNKNISCIMTYRLLGISSQINNDLLFIMTYRLLGK